MPSAPGELDSRRAWVTVGAAFVAMFVVFGVGYSFGAFFTPIGEEFGASSGATSLVFALTAGCWFLVSLATGRAVDRFGPRPVLLVGAVALAAGLLVTAQAERLWVAYLAHGLGVGLAVGCGYIPMVAVVGGWFARRRGVALGVAVSGIGLGTLLGAPLAAVLIAEHGWRTAYQVFGLVGAVVLVGCAVIAHRPPAPTGDPASGVRELLADPRMRALYSSQTLSSLALFIPFVFLPAFATSRGVPPVAAATLVGLIGITSVLGRLLIGALADRLGHVRSYQLCFALMALSYLVWLGSDGYPGLVAFTAVLGVGYGGWIALSPAVVAQLFGVRGLGGLLGLIYTGSALGVLIGPPLAGVIIDAAGYRWAIGLAALLATAALAALLPLGRAVDPAR